MPTTKIRNRRPPLRTVMGKRVRFDRKQDDTINEMRAQSGLSFRRQAERVISQYLTLHGF
jgi:hypothetical protein